MITPEEINTPLLLDYLKKLYQNVQIKPLAKQIEIPLPNLEKILQGKILPKDYQTLENIILYANGDLNDLKEIVKKEPQALFHYWSDIYPDAHPISKIGFVIKEIMGEKKIKQREISEKTNYQQSFIAAIVNCRYKYNINYPVMCNIAKAIDVTPNELLQRHLQSEDIDKERFEFLSFLKEERIKKGWDIKTAAEKLDISQTRLQRIESGKLLTSISLLTTISRVYDLDFDELLKKAHNSKYISKGKESIEDCYRIYVEKKERKVLLDAFLLKLCKEYKNISIKRWTSRSLTEMHTFVTMIFLILTNDFNGMGKYKAEILFYLKNYTKKGILGYQLISEKDLISEEKGIEKLFDYYYREKFGLSIHEISMITGISFSHIQKSSKKFSFPSVDFCEKVLPLLYVPVSVGYENLCIKKSKQDLKNIIQKDKITIEEVVKVLETHDQWHFQDKVIPTYKIKKMFDIIIDSIDRIDKYEQLARLEL